MFFLSGAKQNGQEPRNHGACHGLHCQQFGCYENGTLEAAKELGWEHITVVRSTLEGYEAMAYALADTAFRALSASAVSSRASLPWQSGNTRRSGQTSYTLISFRASWPCWSRRPLPEAKLT